MTAFRTPTDIGQRAIQHIGSVLMDPTLGFSDPSSRAASEISFCYDRLRESELQRNVWTFAVRRAILRALDGNTMLLNPSLWQQNATYFSGSIVSDDSGDLWISRIPNNTGNDPELTTVWEPYFGPLSVPLYDVSGRTAYFSGEIVYTTPGDGTYRVYLSLQNANADVPGTATVYDPTVTYFKNQVVTFSAVSYMSLIDFNLNNEPDLAPVLFNIATTYAAGTKVGGSDGVIYQSIGSGNIGHDPTTSPAFWTNTGALNPWTTVFTGGSGSDKWLEIGGKDFPAGVGLTTLNIVYPVGTGPSTQGATRNVFKLPSGFLRTAPQNPKGTDTSLGGPSGNIFNDWNIENGYLVSAETGPLPFRFVADMTDVSRMNAMFCEGLGARVGLEICETITQSTGKLQAIASQYKKFMDEARTQNAIEAGYDEPPDDDFVSVRM